MLIVVAVALTVIQAAGGLGNICLHGSDLLAGSIGGGGGDFPTDPTGTQVKGRDYTGMTVESQSGHTPD